MNGVARRSGRWLTRSLISALVAVSVAGDAAAEREPERSERWVPAVELGLDGHFDDRSAVVTGNVAPTADGEDTDSIAVVRFGGELLGPRITERWGGPRPFVRIGGQLSLVDKEIVTAGDPKVGGAFALLADAVQQQNRIDMGMPQTPGSMLLGDLDPDDLEGEGTYIRARQNVRPTWYASLGAAWQLASPVHEGWIRLKPSIEYTADEFRYDGFLADVVETAPDVFELTTLRAGRRVREHRLGPGLELETALSEGAHATVSVFFATRFLFLVSDRFNSWGDASGIVTTTFDDVNDVQPVPSTGKSTRFTVQSERLLVRFGGGVRIAFEGL